MSTSNLIKSQHRLLRLFTFSFFMTMGIVVTFFPLYFDYKGYSKLQIGLLYAIGPLIGIATNLLWGFLSDRFQTVKKIMIILIIGQLITAILVFTAGWFSLLYICLAMFFFFQQPVNSLNDSQLMLSIRASGKSYASFRVWGSIGFAVSAGGFGLLLRHYGTGLTPILCLFTITCTLILVFFLKDARQSGKKMALGGMLSILRSKKFVWFLTLVIIMSVSHRFNDGFLALYMRQLGAPDSVIGYAWMASALSEIPMFFFLSKHGHRFKELPLLAFAAIIYALRFFIMGSIHNPVWIIGVQLLHSLTFGVFLITANRYLSQIIPDEYRSSGQAIFAVAWSSIAGLISGMLGGWIYDALGGSTVYVIAGCLSIVAAIGFLATHLFQNDERLPGSR
ncbi:MFS transporter [Paenibacillus sp. CGMCC 1.16610]|uniref:MFS transporter n=1 Tax=Paenibacillus anseongense TaxID=2682845 RepID=A0ABW9UH45_9BACL|nr:MFS transporter [Paenibacillus sp. CGMCC 1.16610]MBA2943846.1 MFS transporter [Paenibacillus sp. CGMCC 1.16610]MVQ37735.1 MFS transporter [Paenibacillus anseongense]